jgi:thioredoxin 1
MKLKFIFVIAFGFLFSIAVLNAQTKEKSNNNSKPAVTFIELGSVNCIPCKAMQPVMKSVEKKYGGQIKIVFYDVWKNDQKQYASQYKIKLIPTQVFLDDKGKEIKRHEGFFAEAEIDKFLKSKGLKVIN